MKSAMSLVLACVLLAPLSGCSIFYHERRATPEELAALPRALYAVPESPVAGVDSTHGVFRLVSVSATPKLCEVTYALYADRELDDKFLRSATWIVEHRLVVEDGLVSPVDNKFITLGTVRPGIRAEHVPLIDSPEIPFEPDDGRVYTAFAHDDGLGWRDAHAAYAMAPLPAPHSVRSVCVIRRLGVIDGLHVVTYSHILCPDKDADAKRLMASPVVGTAPNPDWNVDWRSDDVTWNSGYTVKIEQSERVPVLK